MSLLTPSESHAFQTFLSSMDYADSVSPEWSMYTSHDLLSDHIDIPHAQGKEALAKATKDLMSLDGDSWGGSKPAPNNLHSERQQYEPQRHSAYPEAFPFLNKYPPQQRPQQQHQPQPYIAAMPPHQLYHPPISIPPLHTLGSGNPLLSPSSSSTPTPSDLSFPSSSSSPNTSNSNLTAASNHIYRPPSPRSFGRSHDIPIASTSSAAPSNRRQKPSPRVHPYPIPSSNSNHTTQRPQIQPKSQSLLQNHPPPTHQPLPSKPPLLSPSQKKANHIQSEQKRRANIRRGYEALCETVPALREAIREEELEEAARVAGGNGNGAGGARGADGGSNRGRRGRGRGSKTDDGEKVDGRAGPRSENVVLSKTIDHINVLLSDRRTLLARLHQARASLPPGHPALVPPARAYGFQPQIGRVDMQTSGSTPAVCLWEREWKGGEGKPDREGDGEEGDEGDEEGG